MVSDLDRVLASLLKERGNIYYYLNNGNAGDAFINMGFYTLANKIGLQYRELGKSKLDRINDGDVIIIAGGGALVPEWSDTPSFLQKILNLKKDIKLIILPHSIRGVDCLLKSFPKDTIIFCREKYSYKYCKSFDHINGIFLENDIAFRCDLNSLLKENSTFSPSINYENFIRKTFIIWHQLLSMCGKKSILAMRTDKERNCNSKFKRILRNDFSRIANFGAKNYQASLYSTRKLIKLIDLYREIHTDRLHVAICAAMLGKKVYIYDNGYYKCKGVYEYSMENLKNVTFINND